MNPKLQELTEQYNVIMIMEFGSKLYGTSTPESDTDYKGIFLPTREQILLQRVPKHIKADTKDKHSIGKNTKDDIDIELYSLSYFIELCLKGETVGIDMLHCLDNKIVYRNSDIWGDIRKHRSKFYTNNLKGFVGYCRKQAAKYGIKGSRIADARKVYNFLTEKLNEDFEAYGGPCKKMIEHWDSLPTGEHIHFVKGGKKDKEEEFYQVCGKKMQKTAMVSYCQNMMKKFIDSYGHRALLAEKNEGIDWKAISHAMRYGMQIKELFMKEDIVFPLKEADYLRGIKQGKLNYLKEVAPKLEDLMDEIENLSKNTKLPKKPDYKFWDEFLIDIYSSIV